jgi:rhodanese-related sulfurtransferase
MIEILKKLFGFGPNVNFAELVKNGAVILDVRSKNEFSDGHIKGAINIPVEQLGNNLHKLKDKNRQIITCCASGARSGFAKKMLISNGYLNVYNGGGWSSLNQKIR